MRFLINEIIIKIQKRIHEFFHPTVESLMNEFAIVERATITQEEAEKLLKILDEWKEKEGIEHNG